MRFFVPLIFSGVLGLFSSFDNDILLRLLEAVFRVVAQLGRALRSGRRGRRFKSCQPDHEFERDVSHASLFSYEGSRASQQSRLLV